MYTKLLDFEQNLKKFNLILGPSHAVVFKYKDSKIRHVIAGQITLSLSQNILNFFSIKWHSLYYGTVLLDNYESG